MHFLFSCLGVVLWKNSQIEAGSQKAVATSLAQMLWIHLLAILSKDGEGMAVAVTEWVII